MASAHRRAVGIFPDRPRTASALQALSDTGFSMRNVSVIAKDPERQKAIAGVEVKDETTHHADDGSAVGALTGGVLGGVTGLLVGLGTLTIPGIGPALLAGEAATAIATLVGAGAGVAAGGIVGGLIGMGIPEHRAKHYRDRIEQGSYLVMLKDTEPEIARAERTLKDAGIEDWGVYQAPAEQIEQTDQTVEKKTQYGNEQLFSNDQLSNDQLIREQEISVASGTAADVDTRRGNEYNRVDHPADQDYPHIQDYPHDDTLRPTGPPHASNPVEESPYPTHTSDSDERRVVGIFRDRRQMEMALDRLKKAGFPMSALSVVVREAEGVTPAGQTIGKSHSLSGAIGLASGMDHVNLPEVGSTLIMGPDAQAIAHAVNRNPSHSAVGVLEHLGIAPESANLYSRHLIEGDYLITMRGRNEELLKAASTLGEHGMRDWGIYDIQST